jgi:uncharacterized membrane protein
MTHSTQIKDKNYDLCARPYSYLVRHRYLVGGNSHHRKKCKKKIPIVVKVLNTTKRSYNSNSNSNSNSNCNTHKNSEQQQHILIQMTNKLDMFKIVWVVVTLLIGNIVVFLYISQKNTLRVELALVTQQQNQMAIRSHHYYRFMRVTRVLLFMALD